MSQQVAVIRDDRGGTWCQDMNDMIVADVKERNLVSLHHQSGGHIKTNHGLRSGKL